MRGLLLIMGMILLSGCTSSVTRSALTGDYQQLATEGAKQNQLLSLPTNELWAYCQAFVKSHAFGPVEECFNELDKRFKGADDNLLYMVQGWFDTQFVAPGALGEGMITTLKLESAFAQGDIEKARSLAKQIDTLTRTYGYPMAVTGFYDNERYPLLNTIDESAWSHITRLKHSTQALGTLGLIAAREGNAALATAYAQQISQIDSSSINAANWRLPQAKALWQGRIYLTLGEYEQAYQSMQLEENGLFNFLDSLETVLVEANPLMYGAMIDAYGDTDYNTQLNFIYEFEPRFMLHQAQLETGRLDAAQQGYKSIINEPKVSGYGTVYWQALHGLGRIAAKQGNTEQAVNYFQQAIEVIERQRVSLDNEAGRIGFVNDKQRVYGDMIAILMQSQRFTDAFGYVERSKARALVDLLASKDTFTQKSSSDAIKTLNTIEKQALISEQGTDSNATRGIKIQLSEIQQQTPELASLLTVSPSPLTDIQAHLADAESLVVYYYDDSTSSPVLYSFVISKDSIHAYTQALGELEQNITLLRSAIMQPENMAWQSVAHVLYEQLISPLTDNLRNTQALTLVPHGALHYLPFNVLLNDNNASLISDFRLRLLPAASVMQFIETPPQGNQLLALANPDLNKPELDLPGAQREAAQIAALWQNSMTMTRQQASESFLKSQSAEYQIIHLASHGAFNPEQPLQSGLFLAPDEQNDGYLTVPEIYDLNLQAKLVVLSACETGLGDISKGDDVVGLNRGFLFAGANGIISSLWQVPDEATTLLMTQFYDHLRFVSPSEALAKAQQEAQIQFPHPFYWAAFQLTGGS